VTVIEEEKKSASINGQITMTGELPPSSPSTPTGLWEFGESCEK